MEFRHLLYKRCHTQGAAFGNCKFSPKATATLKIDQFAPYSFQKNCWEEFQKLFPQPICPIMCVATIHRQLRTNARKSVCWTWLALAIQNPPQYLSRSGIRISVATGMQRIDWVDNFVISRKRSWQPKRWDQELISFSRNFLCTTKLADDTPMLLWFTAESAFLQ